MHNIFLGIAIIACVGFIVQLYKERFEIYAQFRLLELIDLIDPHGIDKSDELRIEMFEDLKKNKFYIVILAICLLIDLVNLVL
jgi:hypothetical protein